MRVLTLCRSRFTGRRVVAALLYFGICAVAVGCGAGEMSTNPARVQVSGKVTLDDQPAPAGTIVFVPLTPGQLQSQGIIQEDGTFTIEAENGPSAGDYKVEIQCARKTGRTVQSMSSADGSGMIEERVPIIPAKYNTATTLRKTVTDGANIFHFDLKSKP